MKKILCMAIAAMTAISASAQETVKMLRVYEGDVVLFEHEYNSVDSVVFLDVKAPTGLLSGKFSINESGDQVQFSHGNLQYQASTNTWRFAEHQYDTIGAGNVNASATYDGWIDLFSWATSGYDNTGNDPFAIRFHPWDNATWYIGMENVPITEIDSIDCSLVHIKGKCDTIWKDPVYYNSKDVNQFGYGPSSFMEDQNLTGTNYKYDWGYNPISNGGNKVGQWRTLSKDEWYYILFTRTNAQYLRSQATVCGVHGYVLLPDDFINPGVIWEFDTKNWTTNNFNAEQWAKLEAVGALFLPAAGIRGVSTYQVNEEGYYQTSTRSTGQGNYSARYFHFKENDVYVGDYWRYEGRAVRLVQDVQN